MTKKTFFLLIGGGCHDDTKRQEINGILSYWIKRSEDFSFQKKIKILMVPFARDQKDWEDTNLKYQKRFFEFLGSELDLVFLHADNRMEKFRQQIKCSDLIFLAGGNENLLKEKIDTIGKMLHGKTIIGISAGANILASQYYSNERKAIGDGLGILPVKTICHFSHERMCRLKELSLSDQDFPTIPLWEDSFITLSF